MKSLADRSVVAPPPPTGDRMGDPSVVALAAPTSIDECGGTALAWKRATTEGTRLRCFARLLVIELAILLAGSLLPVAAAAQTGGLRVSIARPGEGETLYAGSDGPRTAIHVLGRVAGSDFDPSEVEVRLEVVQDGVVLQSITGAPDAASGFGFWVSINPLGPEEAGRTSGNCYPCHGYAPVALPPGPSTIRVTAVEPTGRMALAERHVNLDRPGMAALDVRVTIAGEVGVGPSQGTVANLPVTAAGLIYDWRARSFAAKTDDLGRVALAVEALAQAPTHYRISLPPTVARGVLYQSREPVEITLPAGAAQGGPVSLVVEAQLGRIDGTITGGDAPFAATGGPPLTVAAVALPSGRAFMAPAANGKFALTGLPIGRYLIALAPEQAAGRSYALSRVEVDLAARPQSPCVLDLGDPAAGKVAGGAGQQAVRGTVRDAKGKPLFFAWLESEDSKRALPAAPVSGAFAWPAGAAGGGRAVRVSAPGYWSRVLPARAGGNIEAALQPRPDTRTAAWGSGEVIIPAASLADVDGNRIALRRGWAWGSGEGPLTIDTPDGSLRIPRGGRFAVEYIPGESAWLFVFAGEAQAGQVAVKAGEMIAFAGKDVFAPEPVPLDETALRVLWQDRLSPVLFEEEGGVWGRLEAGLAYSGIAAPHPAYAATGAGLLALLGIGTVLVIVRRRKAVRPAGG